MRRQAVCRRVRHHRAPAEADRVAGEAVVVAEVGFKREAGGGRREAEGDDGYLRAPAKAAANSPALAKRSERAFDKDFMIAASARTGTSGLTSVTGFGVSLLCFA